MNILLLVVILKTVQFINVTEPGNYIVIVNDKFQCGETKLKANAIGYSTFLRTTAMDTLTLGILLDFQMLLKKRSLFLTNTIN